MKERVKEFFKLAFFNFFFALFCSLIKLFLFQIEDLEKMTSARTERTEEEKAVLSNLEKKITV